MSIIRDIFCKDRCKHLLIIVFLTGCQLCASQFAVGVAPQVAQEKLLSIPEKYEDRPEIGEDDPAKFFAARKLVESCNAISQNDLVLSGN